jgi:hypothetical protein
VTGEDAASAGSTCQLRNRGIRITAATAVVEYRSPPCLVGDEQPPCVRHLERRQPPQVVEQRCVRLRFERGPQALPAPATMPGKRQRRSRGRVRQSPRFGRAARNRRRTRRPRGEDMRGQPRTSYAIAVKLVRARERSAAPRPPMRPRVPTPWSGRSARDLPARSASLLSRPLRRRAGRRSLSWKGS